LFGEVVADEQAVARHAFGDTGFSLEGDFAGVESCGSGCGV
jgi:hypothetical protein